ncbi:putative 50S ribosomal protein 5 [Helianthus annuus]|nr:putative 50S ribosomal protein 5 [Helianthus annuus]
MFHQSYPFLLFEDQGYPEPGAPPRHNTNTMVVLHFTPIPPTLCCQSPSSRLPSAVTLNASLVRGRNSVNVQTAHFNGVRIEGIKQRGSMVVKASAEIDGAEANDLPSETKDESSSSSSLSVEELPLESKLELKLQQKMKMKLAKKIRLRRKRLVRKRQLRKKGRWPPSKMRKNKNV